MPYVNVVLGLPVEGPFDYLVPENLDKKIPIGARVFVNFRNKKEVAYVVGLSNKTKIKKIKEVISLIDTFPIVDEKMLELCGKLSQYYCCSLGEAIETALPDDLRKGRLIKKGQPLGSLLYSIHWGKYSPYSKLPKLVKPVLFTRAMFCPTLA